MCQKQEWCLRYLKIQSIRKHKRRNGQGTMIICRQNKYDYDDDGHNNNNNNNNIVHYAIIICSVINIRQIELYYYFKNCIKSVNFVIDIK